MAVLLETSKGDIVIDLLCEDCPVTSRNFLKLCKIKAYNNVLFHNVQRNFIVQTGDPTGTGRGGTSIYGVMYGDQARFFDDEIKPHLKHKKKGTVGMASAGPNLNASQFYITTGEDLDSLDEKHTIFGQVTEGFDVLDAINEAFCDEAGRPFQNTRIRHTIILDDPFEDPPELEEHIPEQSPEPQFEQGDRLEDDWVPAKDTRPAEEIEKETRAAEAQNHAVVLEMIGDLPEADAKPPSNMLFVCKLNPVTSEEDLEILFSRFGTVTSCDIIRDWKTGDSLCYGFIGFDSDAACEEAYFKMNNVLIDDRRIKVDFSQSVYHLWKQFKRGGRKGNANLGQEADKHERDQGVAKERLGASGGRLEYRHQGGRFGGAGHGGYHGGHGGRATEMLLLDEEDHDHHHHHHAPAKQQQGSKPAPAYDQHSHRRHDKDIDRHKRHRSRSRSRERGHKQSRSLKSLSGHRTSEKHRYDDQPSSNSHGQGAGLDRSQPSAGISSRDHDYAGSRHHAKDSHQRSSRAPAAGYQDAGRRKPSEDDGYEQSNPSRKHGHDQSRQYQEDDRRDRSERHGSEHRQRESGQERGHRPRHDSPDTPHDRRASSKHREKSHPGNGY